MLLEPTVEIIRKRRAPDGALRRVIPMLLEPTVEIIRKHRAPKGALRHAPVGEGLCSRHDQSESIERQKVHYDPGSPGGHLAAR